MSKVINWLYKPTPKQRLAHSDPAPELMFGGGIGGGKSVFLSAEGYEECREFPGNRIFMGRKVAKHFRETTLQTFFQTVPSEMYIHKANLNEIHVKTSGAPSVIVYGGLNSREEIDRFTSAEYGGILIDQAEELTENDYIQMAPRLRLRRGDGRRPHYRLIFTSNPRKCYLRKHFITAPTARQSFIQSLWKDNEANLPLNYEKTVRDIYKHRPEMISAMLEGNWNILEDVDVVIKSAWVDKCMDPNKCRAHYTTKAGVSLDLARFGDDECVIKGWIGTENVETAITGKKETMTTLGSALAMCRRIKGSFIALEENGGGGTAVDRLREIVDETEDGIEIIAIDVGSKADDQVKYVNKRAEMYFEASEMFDDGLVVLPKDAITADQISGITYHYASNGRLIIDSKEEIKENMGTSPDRADAVVIGLYALKRAKDSKPNRMKKMQSSTQKWVERREQELSGVASGYDHMEE